VILIITYIVRTIHYMNGVNCWIIDQTKDDNKPKK
jgi:hypothetical protein